MNQEKLEKINKAKRLAKLKIWSAVLAAVILLVLGMVWFVKYLKNRETNLPGQFYPNQGQDHVPLNQEASYNSNPPSSGPHFAQSANWGIYDYEVHDKIFIHNMEHGGIWISYRPSVSPKIVDELKAMVDEFGGSKIVMAPRSANDNDIVLAAWTRVLKFNVSGDSLSEEEKSKIKEFYRAFRNKGPELVPDYMPGVDPKSVQ